MATDMQHNKLIKIMFDGNKHLKHVLTDDEIKRIAMIEGRFPLTKFPVCVHCERLGLWHKDANNKPVGYCKSCGTITKNPVTYSTYLAQQMDVDKTGDTFRRMLLVDRKFENYKRMVYLPDFTRMDGGNNG